MSESKESQYAVIENNANAVRAVMSAVESTIGPKGLDTMLVDQFGEVIITNDGVTILNQMEVSHPIAKMIINAVRAQQQAAGDGTTTTALIAGELVLSGLEEITKGVPVAQVIEGIHQGIESACEALRKEAVAVDYQNIEQLFNIALIAGREYQDIAQLIISALQMIGKEKILDENFKFADVIKAVEGADNEVFVGLLVDKGPLNKQMPKRFEENVAIMVLDDALEAESIGKEALATESGFKHYLQVKDTFKENIKKIIASGVNVLLLDRGIDEAAEEMLTDAGVMVLARVPNKTLKAVAEHTGAKMLRRGSLNRPQEQLPEVIGHADVVWFDEKLKQTKIIGGSGLAMATVLVSASTAEIVGERERIAKDAASSVQMAIKEGMVAGGGACELALVRALEECKEQAQGMKSYGIACVISALKRPFMQLVSNAGLNPLEKLGDVLYQQTKTGNHHLAINCETNQVSDMLELGIVDPAYVKSHALKVAGEVAESILRINIVVKRKPYTKEQA